MFFVFVLVASSLLGHHVDLSYGVIWPPACEVPIVHLVISTCPMLLWEICLLIASQFIHDTYHFNSWRPSCCWFSRLFFYVKHPGSGWWHEPYAYVSSAWSEDVTGFWNNHSHLLPNIFLRWHLWYRSPMTTLSHAIPGNSWSSAAIETQTMGALLLVLVQICCLVPFSRLSWMGSWGAKSVKPSAAWGIMSDSQCTCLQHGGDPWWLIFSCTSNMWAKLCIII